MSLKIKWGDCEVDYLDGGRDLVASPSKHGSEPLSSINGNFLSRWTTINSQDVGYCAPNYLLVQQWLRCGRPARISLSLHKRRRRFESPDKIMPLYSTFGVTHTELPSKVGAEAEETPELRAHNSTLCFPCGMSWGWKNVWASSI